MCAHIWPSFGEFNLNVNAQNKFRRQNASFWPHNISFVRDAVYVIHIQFAWNRQKVSEIYLQCQTK